MHIFSPRQWVKFKRGVKGEYWVLNLSSVQKHENANESQCRTGCLLDVKECSDHNSLKQLVVVTLDL